MTSRTVRRWTPEEDEKLVELVSRLAHDGQPIDWTRTAAALPNRSNKDCRKRWYNTLAAGLRKGCWDPEEDLKLREAVDSLGEQWPLVADQIGTRSADQCAKRWNHFLDPELDRSTWTSSEDRALVAAVEQQGHAWKEIQEIHFPKRSTTNIKNRYVTLSRRGSLDATTTLPARRSPSPDEPRTSLESAAVAAQDPSSVRQCQWPEDELTRSESLTSLLPSNLDNTLSQDWFMGQPWQDVADEMTLDATRPSAPHRDVLMPGPPSVLDPSALLNFSQTPTTAVQPQLQPATGLAQPGALSSGGNGALNIGSSDTSLPAVQRSETSFASTSNTTTPGTFCLLIEDPPSNVIMQVAKFLLAEGIKFKIEVR